MGYKTYLGGSSIIGPGAPSDYRYELTDDRRKEFRKRISKKIAGKGSKRPKAAGTLLPADLLPPASVLLIKTVMTDLGKPLPKRKKPLRAALNRLVLEGLVSASGVVNTSHPLMKDWLALMERDG